MYMLPYVLSLLASLTLVKGYNIDIKPFGILNGPSKNSYFGYSTEAQEVKGKLRLWTGSPKYRGEAQNSSASEGAIYTCEIPLQSDAIQSDDVSNTCEKLHVSAGPVKSPENDTEDENSSSSLPPLAETCTFDKDMCGYVTTNSSAWLRKDRYEKLRSNPRARKKNIGFQKKNCFRKEPYGGPISGPRTLKTIEGGVLTLNPDRMLKQTPTNTMFTTTLSSTLIQAHHSQCLRFCFNAFSFADDFSSKYEDITATRSRSVHGRRSGLTRKPYNQPVRSLIVFMKYNNTDERRILYNFTNPGNIASRNWNFTEIDFNHTENINYQLIFEISILNNVKYPCMATSDISLSDITVSNRQCKDESEAADVLESEQSVGMTLDIQKDQHGSEVLTTCGSLWQQNCGFAKESSGICYQFKENSTTPNVIRNPELKGCIRGKMDIVMLIDQSASVNQCNFQKVKRWLRNIIRGFEIGLKQQDIGVVTYSSRKKINNVIPLGLETYGNDGDKKKISMLRILHDLPYQSGQTFTGLAFKHANEMLWGNASRDGAMKMIILLTDGATTLADRKNLKSQVAYAKSRNTTILSVGVAGYDEAELKGISGESNFFGVRDFSQLEKVRDTLRLAVSNVQLEGSKRSKSMQNCQMGFSISSNQDAVIMGGPGCFNLVGDAFTYGDTILNKDDVKPTQESIIQDITLPPDQKQVASTDQAQDVSKIFSIPDLEDIEGVLLKELADSYLGYAVAVGKFYGEDEGTYSAASAPRYNGKGCVVVYKVSSSKPIEKPRILMGQKYGEYYGASLCSEDVNGDGFTDLFVGAPLHSDIEPDEGRVFVYMGGKYLSDDPDIILEGSGKPFSRFGMVISSVGDINADAIPDVVVSAPNEDDGHGVIYIFPGTRGHLNSQYSQRVSASELPDSANLHLFGQSVSGNVDVDNNGYNDIFVGTPGSDQIVILRSRPVVRIISRFYIVNKVIDRRNENCWSGSNTSVATVPTKVPCLQCTACFSYTGRTLPQSIGIRYEIHPDVLEATPRLRFHEKTASQEFHIDMVTLYGAGNEYCFNHSLYLQKDIDDMMTKVKLQLNFDMVLNETQPFEGSTGSDEALMPVLDTHTETSLEDVAIFLLDCQHNLSCKADISVTGSHAITTTGDDLTTFYYMHRGVLQLLVNIVNHGPEEAHAVSVVVGYSPHLSYSATKSSCLTVENEDSVKDSNDDLKHVHLSVKKTFLRANEVCTGELNFIIMPISEVNRIRFVRFHINSSTISLNDSKENNELETRIPIKYRAAFAISGDTEQPELYQPDSQTRMNASASTQAAVQNITHSYTIKNVGRIKLRNLTIQVMWPLCLSVNGTDVPFTYDRTKIQPLNPPVVLDESQILSLSSYGCNVTKEDFDKVFDECFSESVKFCSFLTIFVPEVGIYGDISFSITGSVHWSHIQSIKKTIKLLSEVFVPANKTLGSFSQDQIFHYTVSTTIRPPFQSTKNEVTENLLPPWWIYIVSAVVGIVLLLLFILAMKKTGFFKSQYADKKKLAEEDAYFHELCQPMTSNT